MKVISDIRGLDAGIPIIVVSGRAAEGMRKDAPEFEGVIRFFEKESFDKQAFFAVVEQALQDRLQRDQA
jgi:hypothetical protein